MSEQVTPAEPSLANQLQAAVDAEGKRGPRIVKPPAPTTIDEVKNSNGFQDWWLLEVITKAGAKETVALDNYQPLRDFAFDAVRRIKVFCIVDGYEFRPPNFGDASRGKGIGIVMKKTLAIRSDEIASVAVLELPTVFNAIKVTDLESVAANGM